MSASLRPREGGVDIVVRLTPRSATDAVDGIGTAADGRRHLKVRVRAVPEKGAANAALEKLLAKTLGVASSAVSVVAGGTARLKTVRILGDPAELARAIDALGEA